MSTAIFTFRALLALVAAGVAIGTLGTRVAAQLPAEGLWFEYAPSTSDGDVPVRFADVPSAPNQLTSTLMISRGGLVIPTTNRGVLLYDRCIQPYGSQFTGKIAFAFDSFVNDGSVPDMLLVGPADPSPLPLSAFALVTPPMPLGEVPVPGFLSGGMRVAMADFNGDRTPEILISYGPGGPGTVTLTSPNTNDVIEVIPFGPQFNGGIVPLGADITGDGFAELVVVQEQGGEAKIFELIGNSFIERARLRPFGHQYSGGLDVAALDLNRDKKFDLIFSALGPNRPAIRILDVAPPRPVDRTFITYDYFGGTRIATGYSDGRPAIYATNRNSIERLLLSATGSESDVSFRSPLPAELRDSLLKTFTPQSPR